MKTDYEIQEDYFKLVEEKNEELWEVYFKLKKPCKSLDDHLSANELIKEMVYPKIDELNSYSQYLSEFNQKRTNEIITTWNSLLNNLNNL